MKSDAPVRIAFLGTYPPRRCGIATFTRDLAAGICAADSRVVPFIVAVTETGERHGQGGEVQYEIRQGIKADYARAAELVNYQNVRWVSIQHEYGIFGGDDGIYVLDFLAALQVPAVVTLHTVLATPSEAQRSIVQRMAQLARIVVMSQVAADLLGKSYAIPPEAIDIVPHGIHEIEPRPREDLKTGFGVAGKRMMLTFGLLGPNKGIETVIRALPKILETCPDLVYFVVGATHPGVLRQQGEAYRTTLEREAERLAVRDHVVFRDQFVTKEDLSLYLQATDIFVSPYLNEAQVSSGALSYAMGAGAAVISTPYWHAQELLADGRGRLFPFGDSGALADAVAALLNDESELSRIQDAARDFTRAFVWPRVGARYLSIGAAVESQRPRPIRRAQAPRASSLPELRLDHLVRLTDDTGVIQHATFTVPRRDSGYCVDDNARALMVAIHADGLNGSAETKRLVSIYLAFLHGAQSEAGAFTNFMKYDRSFVPENDVGCSEDCTGRALWSLGVAAQHASSEGHRRLARQMFERGLSRARELGPRGTALVILGLVSFLEAHPEVTPCAELMTALAQKLCDRYRAQATPSWSWFEDDLTYDNALLPLALFRAFSVNSAPEILAVAESSLRFLEESSFQNGRLSLVGNDGWHSKQGARAEADEQSVDAAAFVLAFRTAYSVTGKPHYLHRMAESFAWYLGANRLGLATYDPETAGCFDGLGATSLNLNQGAESTVCFLLSLIAMLDVADEGLESNALVARHRMRGET